VAGARRFYPFQDLISIRAAKGLLDRGVQLRRVRRSVEALRVSIPRVVRPLAELRVVADGQTVVVRGDEGTYEPATGQLVLDFEVRALRDDVVRVLRRGARSDADRRAAYEHYLEGCRLDEEETTFDRAEQSYRRAIELDPSLANAVTNLGNLRFRRGFPDEAEKLYRQALEIDATQPEAYYNLGFLCYERGDADSAIGWFRKALDHDPSFADAHFNLAMALEELGRVREAKPHWETYLRLDPSGPWAGIARRHLK
jgi:tetratricopeptide (TPR) repeat protein